MITQLDPPIPVETPQGRAFAYLVIDRSQEHDLEWVCFQDETRQCWTWRNSDVRIQRNITLGRPHWNSSEPIKPDTVYTTQCGMCYVQAEQKIECQHDWLLVMTDTMCAHPICYYKCTRCGESKEEFQ
jgi:hypothetical protein